MKKKLVCGIATALIGASLVGCMAGCGSNANDYSVYENDRLVLTIWAPDQYAGSAVKAKFQGFLDKFNDTQEMKDLGVVLKFSPMTQLPTVLKPACLSGPTKMPDIVIWDRFATPSNTSFLMPLDELIEKDKIDTSKFLSEAYNELTVGDYQYGLPLDADPWGIYVNMDQVSEYNETAADGDKIDVENMNTWTKLLDAAEKLTVKDAKGGVTRSGLNTTSADGQFFSFVFTGTGELINTDASSATYGDTVMAEGAGLMKDAQSLRVYDSLAFFNELYKKNLCNTGHGGTDAFGNGLCSMTYGSIYFPQELSSYPLKNYKMIPYPARDRSYLNGEDEPAEVLDPTATDKFGMTNGSAGGMLGGYGLTIPQPINKGMRTKEWQKHADKAWEVIKLWLMNDDMLRLYFTENEAITCRTDMWTDSYYTENTGVIADILPYIENYKMRPSVAGYETFESSIVRSEIQSLKEGSQTVLKTYNDIRSSGNALLRQSQGRS